jgi:2'-5' RNA ligase
VRLFAAVDLPEETRRAAQAAAGRLRDHLARAASRSRITWVSAGLHLTLVFLGEVTAESGAAAVERLQEPLPCEPFALGLGAAGMFPSSGRPRVLWLGVAEGAPALASVQAAVVRRLDGIPYKKEDRPFSPHLTLARFRDGGTIEERRAVEQARVAAAGTGLVDRVTLYRSRLSPRGPEYTVLAESLLAGGTRA